MFDHDPHVTLPPELHTTSDGAPARAEYLAPRLTKLDLAETQGLGGMGGDGTAQSSAPL